GTLRLATIFAGGDVHLYGDSIIDANDIAGVAETNIVAHALVLDVGSFGKSNNPIEVELATSGGLSGTVRDNLFVGSSVDLFVNALRSRLGDLTVVSAGNILLGEVAAFNGTITLRSTGGSILDTNDGALNVLSP